MADEISKSLTKEEIGKALVVSFHEQFAQNQNHHQKLFLQVLTILLSVLVGFGYLYMRVEAWSPDAFTQLVTLYYYLGLSMILLSMAISLICNMALGFRRDQLMAVNMRVITGVMDPKSNDNYFFKSFNPQGKTTLRWWMPEFHRIFFFSLIFVKLLLALSVVFYPNKALTKANYYSNKSTVIIIAMIVVVSFVRDIYSWLRYRKKWEAYSDDAPARLKAQVDT